MKQLHRIITATLVCILIIAPAVTGTIYHVNGSGGSDGNTGQSWVTSFATLQKALDVTAAGDTIWIAKGQYVPSQDRNGSTASGRSRYRTFMLKDGVRIYGGFAGNEPPGYDISLRDFSANETILSGDVNGNDGPNFSGNGENTYNVTCAGAGVGSTTVLDGFTISGGYASGSGVPTGYGGGMSIEDGAAPVLKNIVFRANRAGLAGGGAVNVQASAPVFINTQFIGNMGGMRTGGASTIGITNSVFWNNTGANVGGGIRLNGAALTLTNVTFYKNSANNTGGGMDISSSATVDIRNCIFYGNSAPAGANLNGTATTIRNSLIGNNFYDGSGNASPMSPPLFVDTATGDLRLQPGSPLRNTGDPVYFSAGQTPDLSDITTDIAGELRIVGGQIDPGAYQSNYPTCSGTPPVGIITADVDSVCIRETLMLMLSDNSYGVIGISYLWQKRVPSGSGTWADIPLVTDTLLTVSGQASTTDYRCLVICANTSDTSYSNIFTVKSHSCDPRWFVTPAGNDNNRGHDWSDAFATVQKALDVAAAGDTIWIAKGQYVPSQDRNGSTAANRSRYRTFELKDSVRIYGGFAGNEPRSYDINLRDFSANETILSGDINGNDGANFTNTGDNTYNVVAALAGVGRTATLDGFTISGGNANGSGNPIGYGGGISIEDGASPVLKNIVFRANKAGLAGGGGVNVGNNCSPVFINVQFIGNAGGLRAGTSSFIMTNAIFTDNSGANVGGGIRANGGADITLTNVTFYKNSANNSGGGIDVAPAATVVMRNCILYDNTAPTGPDINGTPTILNSQSGGSYYDGAGNITPRGYPMFVDSAARDLRLQALSPLRNMGDPIFFNTGQTPDLSDITTDIVGEPRIIGGQIDPGAYQSSYTSCAGIPLPGIITAAADSVCIRETVSLTLSNNSRGLTGISYLWQKRTPAGSGTWMDIPLVTDTFLTVSGQVATTDYRCLVICGNSLDTSYSNIFMVSSYPCDQRWYVAPGGNDNNTGHSWPDAFATVQKALEASWPGDTVWVAGGRYVPSQDRNGSTAANRSRYRTFMLKDSVQIYGGFAGNEPSGYDINLRDFSANETILSGDINGNDGANFSNTGDNTYNVTCAGTGVGSTTTLDGFTISGGNASGSGVPTGYGGGMSIEDGAAPVLKNIVFRANRAGLAGGGAVNVNASAPTFINTQFIGNMGGMRTGGASTIGIANSVFMNNTGANVGGGIRLNGAALTLTNVTFYNNSANNTGGGMDINSSATVDIRNCIFYGNSAPSGAELNGTATTIRNSLIGSNFYDGSGNASPMAPPLFVNAATGDLRLQPGSPLRNTGDPVYFSAGQTPDLSGISTDIAGGPRIVGGQIDPGAFQTVYPPLDATVIAFIEPEDGDTICADGNFSVKIAVANYGNQPLVNMPVRLDYGTGTANATLTGPLPAGHTDTLVITGVNLTTAGIRQLKAYSMLAGDADTGNDTLQIAVYVHVINPVSLGNDTAFCAGNILALDAGAGSGMTTDWNTGATTSAIDVDTSGIYSVTVTDGIGCMARDTIHITVHPLPVATITPSGHISLCNGDSITLNAGNMPGTTCIWEKDGTVVDTGTNYTTSDGGNYLIRVADGNGCNDSSVITTIELLSTPIVTVTPAEAGFCAGGHVLLQAITQDTTGVIWQWRDIAGDIPKANVSFYQVDIPGTYHVIAMISSAIIACSDTSEMVVITQFPQSTPQIWWDGAMLRTDSSYASYQWYYNSRILPFANEFHYTPVQPGGFSVEATDTNGCVNISASIYIDPAQLDQYTIPAEAIRIYPNPTASVLIVESPVPVQITIGSIDGKAVLQTTPGHAGRTIIDVTDLAAGLYHIRITGSDGLLLRMEKLIKI